MLRLAGLQAHSASRADAGQLAATIPSAEAGRPYHLRVTAVDPGVPYQLDAGVQDGRFTWSEKAVVDPVLGPKPSLDAIAWQGDASPLFVPVALSSAGLSKGGAGTGPRATILSTIPVESYSARLLRDGAKTAFSHEARLRPAATRIAVDLPPRLAKGGYQLWLRVRLLGTAEPEQQIWRLWLP